MRQFLAVTVLLALVALPAAHLLNGAPPVGHNVRSDGIDRSATAAIVAGLQRVGAGLAASLGGASEQTPPEFSVASADRPTEARISALAKTASTSAKIGAGAPPAVLATPATDRYRDVAGVAGRGTAIAYAATGGHRWLVRDYPTAFLWFVLG